MSQNGQTYLKNLAANAARFLKCVLKNLAANAARFLKCAWPFWIIMRQCVWPFWNITRQGVKTSFSSNTSLAIIIRILGKQFDRRDIPARPHMIKLTFLYQNSKLLRQYCNSLCCPRLIYYVKNYCGRLPHITKNQMQDIFIFCVKNYLFFYRDSILLKLLLF